MAKTPKQDKDTNFRVNRIKSLTDLYSDEVSRKNRADQTSVYAASTYTTAESVRKALEDAIADKTNLVEASKKLYVTNPIYASVINYLANIFYFQYYKVIPHKLWTRSKAKAKKVIKEDDFRILYGYMTEVVDGLGIETSFPELLTKLFVTGSTFFTTVFNEESLTVTTLLLPEKYCRTVGQTQYGTYIIEFDCSYFVDLGYTEENLNIFLKGWPKDIIKAYKTYKKDSAKRWAILDPVYSSAVLMNEKGIPTLFYLYGGILDYEKYQDNELERSDNLLRYLVVHTIPHYENELLFEVDEVKALHKSLKKIVDNGDKARLITTYGDVHVDKISDDDATATQVLANAFQAIFNNAGFNASVFTSDSVEALKTAIKRDKSYVWKFVQKYINFFNLCLNNWIQFKGYEVNIDLLPISPYTYDEDVKRYQENATLGVGKIDYIIASGTKQRHIQDIFDLEAFLDLTQITPLQTSYTQTAEDRQEGTDSDDQSDPEIEPSGKDESTDDGKEE